MPVYPQMNSEKFIALMDNLAELILLDINPDNTDGCYLYDLLHEIAEARYLARGGAIRFD